MGDWTGTVPTILAGDVVTGDDWDTVLDILTAATGAWTTWSPTHTNLTVTTATITAKYRRVGKTVDFRWKFLLGASSAVGTSPQFTLPAAPSADHIASFDTIGYGHLIDANGGTRQAVPIFISGSTVQVNHWNATPTSAGTTATVPWTWATGDSLEVRGTYYTD